MWGKLLRKIAIPILLLILSSTMMIGLADSELVQMGDGNYYQVIEISPITWDAANTAAQEIELPEGCTSSHLAVITSTEENDFLLSMFDADLLHSKWLGGFQNPPETEDSAANWEWVTGEAWGFTAWGTGEPNDNEGLASEMFLNLWNGELGVVWNDDDNSTIGTGYILEFECEEELPELDCSTAVSSIDVIWPPNHNMQPVTISGISVTLGGEPIEPEGEIVVSISGISSSEPANDKGDGNTEADYGSEDNGTAWVRAERRGGGEGRTYTINFAASMEGAVGCEGSISVFVPHDQRAHANAEASEHGNANGKGNANGNSANALANAGANGQGQAASANSQGQAIASSHANANASNHGNGNGKGNSNN